MAMPQDVQFAFSAQMPMGLAPVVVRSCELEAYLRTCIKFSVIALELLL